MIESVFTVSDDDQASGVEFPDLEDQQPLGFYLGDPDKPGKSLSPLHTGELPKVNLLMWRAMQRTLNALLQETVSDSEDVVDIELQKRLFQSDSLAITWFISSGQLEKLTNLALASIRARGKEEDESDLRLRLCLSFLSKIRRRNKEESAHLNSRLPSVGLELEYTFDADPDDPKRKFDSSIHFDKHTRLKPLLASFKWYRERASWGEFAIFPTASTATQLRDVLNLIKIGYHPTDCFDPHLTVGGLETSEQHRESQYIQVLVVACGFSTVSTDFLELRRQQGRGSVRFFDQAMKVSGGAASDRYYYVPLLKRRLAKETRLYKPSNIVGDSLVSTEFRTGIPINGFANLIREVNAVYYLSIAAIAHQKPENQRDAVDTLLADVWIETLDNLCALLSEDDILIQDSIEKSFFFTNASTEKEQKNPPILYDLWEVAYQSRQRKVRSKYRKLLAETKHKIKLILKKERS